MIPTLQSNLFLYHVHRNKDYYLTEMEKRKAIMLCTAITLCLTMSALWVIYR